MIAAHAEALDLQARLLEQCRTLAEAIAVPPSRRDGGAILETWRQLTRLRQRSTSACRRLRASVRHMKTEPGHPDHAVRRALDADAKLMGKRLRMWDSMETLVRRHIDPAPSDLVPRPVGQEAGSLLSVLHRALHRLANPHEQTAQADAAGCFTDLPLQVQNFDLLLSAAYRVLLVQGRTAEARFIDVGCGGATTVFIARRYFGHCDGLEYDAGYARAGQTTLSLIGAGDSTVYQADGRTFDRYDHYDVIYFYRPLRDTGKLEELERHIIETARPGTILIAPYDLSLAARSGFDCAVLEEPVFMTGMTQAEADSLRYEACRAGVEIIQRPGAFDFDTGFWSPVLDAASFNGIRMS